MSDSINEQRCRHGKTVAHPTYLGVQCPGPSVVTPPAPERGHPTLIRCGQCSSYLNHDGQGDVYCPAQETHRCDSESAHVPAAPSVSTDHTDEKHCATCYCGRRAPVQRSARLNKPAGSISWAEHLKAWEPYGGRYSQSAERIAERGGFSYGELVDQLGHEPTTWLPIGASRD